MVDIVKLSDDTIEKFISKTAPLVRDFRGKTTWDYIGSQLESVFLDTLNEDLYEHKDDLRLKRDGSSLSSVIVEATRIYLASDPYDTWEDLQIQKEVRHLVTEVLAQTDTQELLVGRSCGQYVWLVLATLMRVAGKDATLAKQAASGYASTAEAYANGVGQPDIDMELETTEELVKTARNLFGSTPRECNHSTLLEVLNGNNPEYIKPLMLQIEKCFPRNTPLARTFVLAGLLVSACLDGTTGFSSTFSFKKGDQ